MVDIEVVLMAGRKPGGKNARITVPMVVRMRALRGIGLSAEAVARVIELDFGTRPHEGTVRHYTDIPGKRGFTRQGIAGIRRAAA